MLSYIHSQFSSYVMPYLQCKTWFKNQFFKKMLTIWVVRNIWIIYFLFIRAFQFPVDSYTLVHLNFDMSDLLKIYLLSLVIFIFILSINICYTVKKWSYFLGGKRLF